MTTAPDPRLMAVADATMDAIGVALVKAGEAPAGGNWRDDPAGVVVRDAILAALKAEGERGAAADSTARIEGDQIVIRVPISTIPIAFDACPDAPRDDEAVTTYVVTDAPTFAKGIVRYLNDEEEDGTTRIHRMLDSAMLEALEQGEEGVEERSALPTEETDR